MTHRATHIPSGFLDKQTGNASLLDALLTHNAAEIASFHTPGHKGIAPISDAKGAWRLDLTELPGLDDLSHPTGVLENLQRSACQLYGSEASYISVNGASAALMAAMLACAPRGGKCLMPRNAHRSAINALVISGLEPVWFQPEIETELAVLGAVDEAAFADALTRHAGQLAFALVVSPTYAGIVSNIAELAKLARMHDVPLIVDEAHGGHFVPGSGMPSSAVAAGADLVVHSLHKTLGALTQTGMIHVGMGSPVPPPAVRACLNMLLTSSPSYLLLASVEQALVTASDRATINGLIAMRQRFIKQMRTVKGVSVFDSANIDPLHLLISISGIRAEALFEECCHWGVFPEAVLGNQVLFLLGVGSKAYELESLADALEHIALDSRLPFHDDEMPTHMSASELFGEQIISPRQAFFSRCETITANLAIGRIAAECIAPCPPGVPIISPGIRITPAAIALSPQTHIRVVVESGSRRA